MASQVVFVAGLTHSGSTVLDLLLGRHPRLVGLGEVVPLLRPGSRKLDEPDRSCSCGALLTVCPFWSPAREALREYPDAPLPQRYRVLMDVFGEVFGKDQIPLDSSKSLRALQIVAAVPDLSVRVLHLLRDVRSWTVSRLDTDVRRRMFTLRDLYALYGRQVWRPFALRSASARFLVWYHGNRRIQRLVAEKNLPVFQFGYEEFSLNPDRFAGEVCRFLEIEPLPSQPVLSGSKSHIALGNRMRLRPDKQVAISYDSRWFYRTEWVLPSLLLPHVMRYNRRNVYRNTRLPLPRSAGELRQPTPSHQ